MVWHKRCRLRADRLNFSARNPTNLLAIGYCDYGIVLLRNEAGNSCLILERYFVGLVTFGHLLRRINQRLRKFLWREPACDSGQIRSKNAAFTARRGPPSMTGVTL